MFNKRNTQISEIPTTHKKISSTAGIVSKGNSFVQYNYITDSRVAVLNLMGNVFPSNVKIQVRNVKGINGEINSTLLILDSKERTIVRQSYKFNENDDLSVLLNIAVNAAEKLQ